MKVVNCYSTSLQDSALLTFPQMGGGERRGAAVTAFVDTPCYWSRTFQLPLEACEEGWGHPLALASLAIAVHSIPPSPPPSPSPSPLLTPSLPSSFPKNTSQPHTREGNHTSGLTLSLALPLVPSSSSPPPPLSPQTPIRQGDHTSLPSLSPSPS